MSSKFTEGFDSLQSSDEIKRGRVERVILAAKSENNDILAGQTQNAVSAVKARRRLFQGRRGVALLIAAVILFSVAVAVPLGVYLYNNRGMLGAMAKLINTSVDMEGVAAFGVWNAPESDSASASISDVSFVSAAAESSFKKEAVERAADDGVISGEWSDDDRFDWESDYDWDPTKANVLIAINEDGKINEVVYERINGRGQVRQDVLGNAAKVYVSNGFTFVLYVNDQTWEWWKDEESLAHEICSTGGFGCHHEREQTVVIHNATGKVFALKDIIPQVNELSGAINYTLSVQPYKNDYICVNTLYGNHVPQWYTVVYDERTEKIRYELMLPADSDVITSYSLLRFVYAARRDKYGQQYLLESHNTADNPRITAGIVNLGDYDRYGKTIVCRQQNEVLFGTDGRMYAFDEGKLKVFGENFELRPVEEGLEVTFEGVANDFFFSGRGNNEGIAYKLSGGYLYSMFGEVWKVEKDGALQFCEQLEGSFPRYADEGFLIGGEIIAFVDTETITLGKCSYSVNGKIVHIDFERTDDEFRMISERIIDASEMHVYENNRMIAEQNENPMSINRGHSKHYLITVTDGKPYADYFAYGYNGAMIGLTRPITEPLVVS